MKKFVILGDSTCDLNGDLRKQYDIDYQKKNIRRINLSLHRENDKDIIAYLESQTNVQGTLKRMIRKYMKEKKQ